MITAIPIPANATSKSYGVNASSSAAGTSFSNLMVNGTAVNNPGPNTSIAIAGVGTVAVNEQSATGNGTTSSGLTVNALDVSLLAGGNIVVASAKSSATCSGPAV